MLSILLFIKGTEIIKLVCRSGIIKNEWEPGYET